MAHIKIQKRIKEYEHEPASARVYLQSSFKEFIAAFHFLTKYDEFIFADFHCELIKLLEEMVFDKPFNLLFNMPTRTGKSEIMTYFMCWTYTINPFCNNIRVCYSDELVGKFSEKMISIVESDLYKKVFGIELSTDSRSFWKVKGGGETRAVSVGGGITGFGAGVMGKEYGGCLNIDDAQKPTDAYSVAKSSHLKDIYKETLKSRKNNKTRTPTILNAQRICIDDFTGFILDEIEKGNELNWKKFIVPAIKDGKSFWEMHSPIEFLKHERKADPYTFAAQYQQEPIEEKSSLWKRKWIQYKEAPTDIARIVVGVDPAGGGPDEVGIVVCGKTAEEKYFVLADHSMRGSPAKWAEMVVNTYQNYRADLVVCERNYGGDMVESTLKTAGECNIKQIVSTRGKVVRAEPISALYERGLVYHAQEMEELEKELTHMGSARINKSPNRADALVFALAELSGEGVGMLPVSFSQGMKERRNRNR
ncbi:MAG: hypothetical protein LBQ37_02515 [Elusimicrobiota bacterium]|jgi:hypothetical protein|nr:hypothetical protein [Elusimicrobiota bacterium]